jgi:hypothetical protein
MDLDAGVAHRTNDDRQGEPLEEWEVHMNVEAFGLETGEPVGDGLEPFAHGVEMIETLFQAEVAQIIGAKLVA